MKTSYFAKYKGDNGVCISLYPPKWYKGRVCSVLAPTPELLREYKKGKVTEEEYEKLYRIQTLRKLSPTKVLNKFDDCVLLCYEKSTDFCHRHIIAKWIKEELGVDVIEI